MIVTVACCARRGTSLLHINGFSASYGQVPALREVDLHVDAGEAVCLLGSNGAGKSTLIRSVMGLGPSVSGEMRFEETDLFSAGVEDRVRNGLAVVFEGRGILRGMTVQRTFLWVDIAGVRSKLLLH